MTATAMVIGNSSMTETLSQKNWLIASVMVFESENSWGVVRYEYESLHIIESERETCLYAC